MELLPLSLAHIVSRELKTLAASEWPPSSRPIDEGARSGPWSDVDQSPEWWIETEALHLAAEILPMLSADVSAGDVEVIADVAWRALFARLVVTMHEIDRDSAEAWGLRLARSIHASAPLARPIELYGPHTDGSWTAAVRGTPTKMPVECEGATADEAARAVVSKLRGLWAVHYAATDGQVSGDAESPGAAR